MEKVVIESCARGSKATFPIVRWMRAKDELAIQKFDWSLPQDDEHPKQRTQELEKKRKLYQLVEKIPGGPLQLSTLPSDEQFSHDYLVCTAIIYVVWRGLRPGADLGVVHEIKLCRFLFPLPSNKNSFFFLRML